MAQTKIYPSTQAQVQAVQSTVDEINAKIVTPNYQVKTVTPSNVQQTVQADSGYTALSGVVVNPISALMPENLEDYILRKGSMPEFSLVLNGDVPSYACFNQTKLLTVYGVILSVSEYALYNCSSLQSIDCSKATTIGNSAFYGCSALQNIDCSSATTIGNSAFTGCSALQSINCANATSLYQQMFRGHSRLKSAILSSLSALPTLAFYQSVIEYVDLRNVNTINIDGLAGCNSLKLLDISNSHTAVLANTSALTNTTNLRIIVADTTDKAYYQSATNWNAFASKIRTVAEFEQEIGMTYDEYYLQVFGHARNEVQA